MIRTYLGGLLALLAGLLAPQAHAQSTDTMSVTGASKVRVVEPISIVNISDLRFGTLMQPLTNGIVEVAADGAVTTNLDLSTFPNGRAPARFTVLGEAQRRFIIFVPNRINISNGTSTMRVDRFRTNLDRGFGRFDAVGSYDLYVGGRLHVDANQEPGSYSGTFEVAVLYL